MDVDIIMDDMADTKKLSDKIRNRDNCLKENIESFDGNEFIEPTAVAMRHKSKKRGPLTLAEKIDIVDKVKFKWVPQDEVAKEFRVSP